MAREGKVPAVKLEFVKDNKVIICVPYDQALIKKIKTISGRRWNPKEKHWEVPYSKNLISKLQDIFGKILLLTPISTLILYRRHFQ